MNVYGYKVGRYPAIIRKTYDTGIEYETDFTDADDFFLSVNALIECIGHVCGTGDQAARLETLEIIYGRDEIEKALRLANAMR